MTDLECLARVAGLLVPGNQGFRALRRNGNLLLAIPQTPEAAARTISLYQPQRGPARAVVAVLRFLARTGNHRWILPQLPVSAERSNLSPALPEIPGETGILLGSPEHRVRRAIATYQGPHGWEVAKIAFGEEGCEILESEASALRAIREFTTAAPALLGLHRGAESTVLRMPFMTGHRLQPGEIQSPLTLLDSWFRELPARTMSEFEEWPSIERALVSSSEGIGARDALKHIMLRPAIRHGDFARWNLLRHSDGGISAIDWEWGHPEGVPGLDLVHYFLQDERLVRRLPCSSALTATVLRLREAGCSRLLSDAGWPGDPLLPVIASLAYKQGAGHQENRRILEAALQQWAEHHPKA